MRLAWVTFVLAASGCASPLEAVAPRNGLRIVHRSVAQARAAAGEKLSLPFGQGQNGTELLVAFLERAEAGGVAFVSDISIAWVFRWRGIPVECRAQVFLDGDPAAPRAIAAATEPPAAGDGYTTEVEDFRPTTLAARVTDSELFCERHAVRAGKARGYREVGSWLGAESARFVDQPPGEEDWELHFVDECARRPVTHETRRYDYELKLGFVPVHWEYVAARFADRRLVEAPAVCYRLEEHDAAGAMHRLTATIYRRARTEHDTPPPEGAMKPPAEPVHMHETHD